jgi:thioredoxin reductase
MRGAVSRSGALGGKCDSGRNGRLPSTHDRIATMSHRPGVREPTLRPSPPQDGITDGDVVLHFTTEDHMNPLREFDAVIVGGGPAGLSAALVLGRARRSVLVIDHGRPANAVSHGVGGLLGQAAVDPAALRATGREQLARHPTVEVCDDEVAGIDRRGGGFVVDLERRGDVRASAVVLAHGLRYDPPPLAGIDELWGRSVFHCAFCDGWEVRDLPLALHGRGPAAARSALVLASWSDDVVLCSDGPFVGDRAALASAGVRIREEPIRRLVGSAGHLERIEFEHGPSELRDALFVSTRRGQPNDLAGTLGCELTDAGTIVTDVDGRTSVSGVYAVGDAATAHSRSVANAIGTGSRAAYSLVLDRVPALAA